MALTPLQRKYLKGLAHALQPTVIFGKLGLSDGLISETNLALKSHELIKVKFNQSKEDKGTIAPELAESVEAELVAVLGNMAILYKPSEKEEDRKIKLPK